MRHSRKLATLLLLVMLLTACPKSTEERVTLKRQAIGYTDTLANSIKLAIGVTTDLYKADKLSKETATAYANRLKDANSIGKEIGKRVKAIDVNASVLPSDLSGMLDEVESLLRTFDFGSYEQIIQAVTDAIRAVESLRKMVKQ